MGHATRSFQGQAIFSFRSELTVVSRVTINLQHLSTEPGKMFFSVFAITPRAPGEPDRRWRVSPEGAFIPDIRPEVTSFCFCFSWRLYLDRRFICMKRPGSHDIFIMWIDCFYNMFSRLVRFWRTGCRQSNRSRRRANWLRVSDIFPS